MIEFADGVRLDSLKSGQIGPFEEKCAAHGGSEIGASNFQGQGIIVLQNRPQTVAQIDLKTNKLAAILLEELETAIFSVAGCPQTQLVTMLAEDTKVTPCV